ncbi:predicted protein [Sclerotinia sclerotiorum 1980 UF-70]|uniref:Uncharacterized protein n=1 Tax=Sclerotinia sclerotiorum (strain ATCC 18683 / 1980 / Ss-1) TaxID=665079 RepID=A7F8U0_SCLS1|nr:predicted protein [Sclerotinia sclerotiorum 1980 UF-70]EDN99161.1 predicted protein [Sclerotinia sclerotiorum 1980 UF-70]
MQIWKTTLDMSLEGFVKEVQGEKVRYDVTFNILLYDAYHVSQG